MKKQIISYSDPGKLPFVASQLLELAPTGSKTFAFYGEMGAGKTTLIKEICSKLGSEDSFSSPTYSIVNEYLTQSGEKIYHMDLYRLNKLEEVLELGIEEYLNSGDYVFIEWPGLIERLLPEEVVKIEMQVHNNMRELSIFIR